MSDSESLLPMKAAPDEAKPTGSAQESAGEVVDGLVKVTKTKWWIALATIAGIIVVAVVWSFTATLPQYASAPGSLYIPGQLIIVPSSSSGSVVGLPPCAPGCSVTKGEVLFTVRTFETGKDVNVTAPGAGTLGAVTLILGDTVSEGEALTAINLTQEQLETDYLAHNYAVAEVNQTTANQFPVGAPAYVQANSVNAQSNGVMNGQVISVSQDVTGQSSQAQDLSNPRFHLLVDLGAEQTWTGMPPLSPVPSGTQVTIGRITADPHPIDLIFGS